MALRPIDSSLNLLKSIKKYLVDNLITTEGFVVNFDKSFFDVHAIDLDRVEKWIIVDVANIQYGTVCLVDLIIYLHSRRDQDAEILASMRDVVLKYFNSADYDDGQVRIPFYDTLSGQPWTHIATMVAGVTEESGVMRAPDETKYKAISIELRLAT